MSKTDDKWTTYHALRHQVNNLGNTGSLEGFEQRLRCQESCADPVCKKRRCLNASGKGFRQELMLGVRRSRKLGKPDFPVTIVGTINGRKRQNCPGARGSCDDEVCKIIGCMDRPAYLFRDLLRLGYAEQSDQIKDLMERDKIREKEWAKAREENDE